VAIVGGSIAGSTAAIELSRVGCNVTIYERSKKGLDNRGAGIMLSEFMVQKLKKRDLIDRDWAFLSSQEILLIMKREKEENPQSHSYRGVTANWGVLHDNLRKRISDDLYIQNRQVVSLNVLKNGSIKLFFPDKNYEVFDLVIFADGYNSIGRKILFPDLILKYAGYIAWRGIIEEKALPYSEKFENKIINAVSDEGAFISYTIPSRDHEINKGRRLLNWVFYIKTEESDLNSILTDRNGNRHRSSVPPGAVGKKELDLLHHIASRQLPDYIAEAICNTEEPFIQGIFDIQVPHYHKGHVCLIGDAATLARPHTGGGTAKAMLNAINLARSLSTSDSIDQGLSNWDSKEAAVGKMMASLGEDLGKVLITEAPNWALLDEISIKRLWNRIIEMRNYIIPDD